MFTLSLLSLLSQPTGGLVVTMLLGALFLSLTASIFAGIRLLEWFVEHWVDDWFTFRRFWLGAESLTMTRRYVRVHLFRWIDPVTEGFRTTISLTWRPHLFCGPVYTWTTDRLWKRLHRVRRSIMEPTPSQQYWRLGTLVILLAFSGVVVLAFAEGSRGNLLGVGLLMGVLGVANTPWGRRADHEKRVIRARPVIAKRSAPTGWEVVDTSTPQ